jgi:hypothetical protein
LGIVRRRKAHGAGAQTIPTTQYLVSSGDGHPFTVMIEPEAMEYSFPPHEPVGFDVQAPNVRDRTH